MEIDYGKHQLRSDANRFEPGDEIFVLTGKDPTGLLTAYYVDYVRTKPLLILPDVFVSAILLMRRWKGFGSLLALAFSKLMIIEYIIPHILAGEEPLRVGLIGLTILLTTTLYVTYGWNMKTHASVISMVLALVLTGLLLGGMIIGALGVLDDLVSTQSAAVFEIHDANPALDFRYIFEKSI